MPELLLGAWQTPGIGWLGLIVFVAGVVRGFAGFGTGLIFIPLAAMHIPPVWVLVALMTADLVATLPLIPGAFRDGSLPDLAALLPGCVICLPAGTLLLEPVDPVLFRWSVALLALGMVALLASGWRHRIVFGRCRAAGVRIRTAHAHQ